MRLSAKMLLVGVLVLLALVPNAAQAQESRATITGTVTDPSSALVPGATVEITNVATGVVAKTVCQRLRRLPDSLLDPGPL